MREKLDYMIGVYNNAVFISKCMHFDDEEKNQKEYNMMMHNNNNIDNILQVLHKRSASNQSKFWYEAAIIILVL